MTSTVTGTSHTGAAVRYRSHRALSPRLGPEGRGVGLDAEPRMIEMARRTVGERHLRNVSLMAADAADTGLPRSSFDLVHTRLFLMNVPHTDDVLDEMVNGMDVMPGRQLPGMLRRRGWLNVRVRASTTASSRTPNSTTTSKRCPATSPTPARWSCTPPCSRPGAHARPTP
ncbi:class I SAM-dependent methyltransferase [Streptomyces sp. NPDC007983]|uniref:class I SAM-dependent methyltransferase n=1 Tax=Streptomyces sp. NPDC007983 TaxID=3364800 RepID=UPI0036E735DC